MIYYEKLLRRCHPNNRPRMEALLAEARRGEGETLFEKLTALIARTDTGHDCTLSLEKAIKKNDPPHERSCGGFCAAYGKTVDMVESYVIPLICGSLLVVLLGCIRLLDLRANKLPTE